MVTMSTYCWAQPCSHDSSRRFRMLFRVWIGLGLYATIPQLGRQSQDTSHQVMYVSYVICIADTRESVIYPGASLSRIAGYYAHDTGTKSLIYTISIFFFSLSDFNSPCLSYIQNHSPHPTTSQPLPALRRREILLSIFASRRKNSVSIIRVS